MGAEAVHTVGCPSVLALPEPGESRQEELVRMNCVLLASFGLCALKLGSIKIV